MEAITATITEGHEDPADSDNLITSAANKRTGRWSIYQQETELDWANLFKPLFGRKYILLMCKNLDSFRCESY